MRRTQLYLDDDLWNALHVQARKEGTSISDLVRRAARKQYLDQWEERRRAMQAIVGIWQDRDDLPDTAEYVRSLRRGKRIERLREK